MSNTYMNAFNSQEANEKAALKAKEELKRLGMIDPILSPHYKFNGTPSDYYAGIRAYSERLSALTIHYLRLPSGDRPLIPLSVGDKTTPIDRKSRIVQPSSTRKLSYAKRHPDDWGRPYCDD